MRHDVLDLRHFARLERLRFLEAVAEFSAEHFATNELLITTHLDAGGIGIGVRMIAGINVDQFHNPVRVGAAR